MFWCCCKGTGDDSKANTVNTTGEYEPGRGMNEEAEAWEQGEAAFNPSSPAAVVAKADQERLGDAFLVRLAKSAHGPDDESPFGVSLFYSDAVNYLEIIDVDESNPSVKLHNEQAELRNVLKPGQLILAVNDVTNGVASMLAEWKKGDEVSCHVCWPREFTITVNKGTSGMGIDVTHSKKGTSLLIEGIHVGPVLKWNSDNPERKVEVADRIVCVNGIRGSPSELKGALKKAQGTIELIMSRRPS